VILDCAHYKDGERQHEGALSIHEASERCKSDGFVWLGLHDPAVEELREVAERFELPPLAVEDAMQAHQRPKIEDYANGYFLVLHTARYLDDVEEVEVAVFGEQEDQTRRIYFLRRELAEFYRAVHPVLQPLDLLVSAEYPDISPKLGEHLRDIADHVKRIEDSITTQRELLTSILQANLAVISLQQNDVVKKISGWAAVIAVPTLIASVYGMNFKHMPELTWRYGYPAAVTLMLVVGYVLNRILRRAGWL